MSETLHLPRSGVVLSYIIDAFDLRRWDRKRILSPHNGTTARFLQGKRFGEETEQRIFHAVGEALVESGIVPSATVSSFLPPPLAKALARASPAEVFATAFALSAKQGAAHWDAMRGALHRLSPPVLSQRLAHVACLQLVTTDVAVRLVGLFWLTRSTIDTPPHIPWAIKDGMRDLLRSLQRRSGLTREQLAEAARVDNHTLDAWLDAGVRPTEENLHELSLVLSEHGLGESEALLHELRRSYGLRDLFAHVVEAVGEEHAVGMARRLVGYALWMLGLPRVSKKSVEENDFKMYMALTIGTLGREQLTLPWVESMLNSVWRADVDPVWRTSIKAATRSWFERMQEVAARLPPGDGERLAAALGAKLTVEVLDQIGYLALASKEELARDLGVRAAMDAEAGDDGYFGALELKVRASEASNHGDLLAAIDLLREAVAKDPRNAELHYRLGANLWQIADVDEGMRELEIAVQFDPGWDRSQVEVAIVLLNQDRNEEAARRLEAAKALLREPSRWLLLHLGFARERLGDDNAAAAAYEELLALDADHAEALDRLAHLCLVRGDKRMGAELAKRAAHLGFTDVFAAWSEGYYNRTRVPGRPPRTTPHDLVQLGDDTWLKPRGAPFSG